MKTDEWSEMLLKWKKRTASREPHRKGKSDMEWAGWQVQGPPKFVMGDVVEFKVGGFGIIRDVTKPHDGWPSSYSADPVPSKKFHAYNKAAWHYEGDIKRLVAKSALRKFKMPRIP